MEQSELARLVARDAELLRQRAKTVGVSAYLSQRAVRETPNARFLQSTMRNVESCEQHANKRAEESSMWAAYERRKALGRGERSLQGSEVNERTSVHSSERRDRADPSPSLPARSRTSASTSQNVAARHVVRGRGGVGTRALDGEAATLEISANGLKKTSSRKRIGDKLDKKVAKKEKRDKKDRKRSKSEKKNERREGERHSSAGRSGRSEDR